MPKTAEEQIDEILKRTETEAQFGGADIHRSCKALENIMRDLKVFDQKRHRAEQLDADINRRFEALVISLEKIVKILKENGLA